MNREGSLYIMRKKIGFISDTHGGIGETLRALEVLKDCETIYHLGDVLYHGPRNALPGDYNPKDLAAYLKERDNIIYVRGNCDSDVDQMVTDKDLTNKMRVLDINGLKTMLIHGYEETEFARLEYAKDSGIKMIVTGHTHIKVLDVKDGIILLNPGSTTIPKDGIASVAMMDDKTIKLINIYTEEVLKEIKY